MKLNEDMLFTHPVLAPSSDDYRDARFEMDVLVSLEKDSLDLLVTTQLECKELHALIDAGEAGCGFFLICLPTYTNRLVPSAVGTTAHRFRAADFFGTVRVRPVVWSKKGQSAWRCASLHTEYGGSATLPEATILAYGVEQSFTVDRERLKPFESIFALEAFDSLKPGEIAVDPDADKVTIKVHSQTKESVDNIRNSGIGRDFLLNAVYLPAIMQLLHEVAGEPTRWEHRLWYRIFAAKCAAAGVNLDQPEYLRDAQRMLGYPFQRIEREKERLFS